MLLCINERQRPSITYASSSPLSADCMQVPSPSPPRSSECGCKSEGALRQMQRRQSIWRQGLSPASSGGGLFIWPGMVVGTLGTSSGWGRIDASLTTRDVCVCVRGYFFTTPFNKTDNKKTTTSSYVSSDTQANPYSAVFERVLMGSLVGRLT